MENETEREYQVIMYAYVTASSLEEAEDLYADGEYYIDYHEICDYDSVTGAEVKYDQWDIEAMKKEKSDEQV